MTTIDLTKYESVATVLELRGLKAAHKRLGVLRGNRLVTEYGDLIGDVKALTDDLDAKLAALEATP